MVFPWKLIAASRFSIPDSRFPIPDSRFPINHKSLITSKLHYIALH
ncbi:MULTISPECIES: hypothetical protein [Moorena]|nr:MULTISPECIES: hypothetical protein [Moorena]NEP24501.1 hypothetical protein [Moorena sp. SIO3I6]